MSEPVVGFRSIITPLNVGATATSPGFAVAALANGLTYDRWQAPASLIATTGQRIWVNLSAPATCDYFAIAAHNLRGNGVTPAAVEVRTCTAANGGGTVTPRALITFADDKSPPRLQTFAPVASQFWEISLALPINVAEFFSVGVLYLGQALTFEHCIAKSHAPAPLNRSTTFYDATSESGQFAGRSINRRGFVTSVSPDRMTAAWVRSQFQPFVKAARIAPYFFAWNPGDYPDEVVFGRTSDDIGAEYTGDRDRMKASWDIEGLGWDD